jgi:hypothetical protein
MTAAVVTPYTVPVGMMDALQITILVLVAAGATAVVLVRDRVRQVVVLSVYGILLAVLCGEELIRPAASINRRHWAGVSVLAESIEGRRWLRFSAERS